tara:strand:- start:1913 stop:2299 length:387 start_codon:yes stop_codon:yes gene_type:complete
MKKLILVLPSFLTILVASLPVLTCPACWPLYAGLLSSLGINFTNYTSYILPLTLFLLTISLLALGWRAKKRRGFIPLIIGLFGVIPILLGRFYMENDWLFYSGIALLVGASIWNVWPKRGNCSNCKGD